MIILIVVTYLVVGAVVALPFACDTAYWTMQEGAGAGFVYILYTLMWPVLLVGWLLLLALKLIGKLVE